MAHQIAHPTARISGTSETSEINYTPGPAGHFTEGDPITGEPATVVTMDWLNMVQDEIKNVVEKAGIPLANPNQPDNAQLSQAIPRLTRWNLPVRTIVTYGNTNPQGSHHANQDHGRLIPCDTSLGHIQILLPAASVAGNGFTLGILKVDDSDHLVTVKQAENEKIQGAVKPYILSQKDQSVLLTCNGIDGWQVIGNSSENINLAALRTDIDLNSAEIALQDMSSLDLHDGVSLKLGNMNDADNGSQNVIIQNGIASSYNEFGPYVHTTYTGSDEIFTVPANAKVIKVKMWGGGGGGGRKSSTAVGGGGGYAFAELPVIPNEALLLSVGGGGTVIGKQGGGGGGYSAIFRGDKLQSDALMIAGGGGGAGTGSNNGGGGGGVAGQAGVGQTAIVGGAGGTTSAGGAGGQGGQFVGKPGTALTGGDGPSNNYFSAGGYNGGGTATLTGGGGGGYFGGGSGGANDHGPNKAGGGGGSGFVHSSLANTQLISAVGAAAGQETDIDKPIDIGSGGEKQTDGQHGAILISVPTAALDMNWMTPLEIADAPIQKHRIQFLLTSDNAQLNNNLIITATSNAGAKWENIHARQIGVLSDGRKIIVAEGIDTAGGINVQARIQTNSGINVEISDFTHHWEN